MKYSKWSGELTIKCKDWYVYKYDMHTPEKIVMKQDANLSSMEFIWLKNKNEVSFFKNASFDNCIINISLFIKDGNKIVLSIRHYSHYEKNIINVTCFILDEPKKTLTQIKDFLHSFFIGKRGWQYNEPTNKLNEFTFTNPDAEKPYIYKPPVPSSFSREYVNSGEQSGSKVSYDSDSVPMILEPFDYTATRAYREEVAANRGTFGVISNNGYLSTKKKKNDKKTK